MKILFLGGSGFLGRVLLRSLSPEVRPFAVARSPESARRIGEACPAATILSADQAAETSFDRVVNLVVDYGRGGAALARLIPSNLLYPVEILERVQAEVVLNVSTALPSTYSPYALSKKLLEQSLDYLEARTGRRFVNIHLHNMYGPGAEATEFVGFVVRRMLANEPVEVSPCRNARDFIFLDDAVDALLRLCAHPHDLPPGRPVEVGTGQSTCLRDAVLLIRELAGSASEIRFGARPANPFEPDRLQADTAALRRLGWAPRFSLREGIGATIAALDRQERAGA